MTAGVHLVAFKESNQEGVESMSLTSLANACLASLSGSLSIVIVRIFGGFWRGGVLPLWSVMRTVPVMAQWSVEYLALNGLVCNVETLSQSTGARK